MRNSKIEWTDDTDNIIVAVGGGWWCRKISPECDSCYAEIVNDNDFFGGNHLPYLGTPPKLALRRDVIAKWARQTTPRKHFVMSLSDIFGEWVPRDWQFEFLDAMLAAPLQTFQLLTKRANVGLKSIKFWMAARGLEKAPANIWFGFTAGDQKRFDLRWKSAKELAARGFTIFVSAEPLLAAYRLPPDFLALGRRAQVVVGGESGTRGRDPKTGEMRNIIPRPMHPTWVRYLRDQCVESGVAFFFKQRGAWTWVDEENDKPEIPQNWRDRPDEFICLAPDGTRATGYGGGGEEFLALVGKKEAGRILDGATWSEFPVAA